jgi:hypothetical protein
MVRLTRKALSSLQVASMPRARPPESLSLDPMAVIGSEHCFGNPSVFLERVSYNNRFTIVIDPRRDEEPPGSFCRKARIARVQGPASCKSRAADPACARRGPCEVDDMKVRARIPLVEPMDCLPEFNRVRFVYTTSIDPG